MSMLLLASLASRSGRRRDETTTTKTTIERCADWRATGCPSRVVEFLLPGESEAAAPAAATGIDYADRFSAVSRCGRRSGPSSESGRRHFANKLILPPPPPLHCCGRTEHTKDLAAAHLATVLAANRSQNKQQQLIVCRPWACATATGLELARKWRTNCNLVGLASSESLCLMAIAVLSATIGAVVN